MLGPTVVEEAKEQAPERLVYKFSPSIICCLHVRWPEQTVLLTVVFSRDRDLNDLRIVVFKQV